MTETYKYEGTFTTTNLPVILLTRRIAGLHQYQFAKSICISTAHSPAAMEIEGESTHGNFRVAAYKPSQVRWVEWMQPQGREYIRIEKDAAAEKWQVTYRGEGSFNGSFYMALVEALPEINPCAAVVVRLMVAARYLAKSAKGRRNAVLRAAWQLIETEEPATALGSLPQPMAKKLAKLPQDILALGINTLRSNRARLVVPRPA